MLYKSLVSSILGVFLVGGVSVGAAPVGPAISVPAVTSAEVQPVVYPSTNFGTALNNFRTRNGRVAVRDNSLLATAAQRHARYLAERGILSHTGRNGSTFAQRAKAAGCNFGTVAENVAFGYTSADAVIRGWANSPGHRANMLGSSFRVYGLGRSGNYWVLMLADRC